MNDPRHLIAAVVVGALLTVLVFIYTIQLPAGPNIAVDTHATSVPTPPPGWHPENCPVIKDFVPNRILHLGEFVGQTTYDAHGCPAALVLIPLKGVPRNASPTATRTPNPRRSDRNNRGTK